MAALDLSTVKAWMLRTFKPINAETVCSVLTVTFDPAFLGETWTVTDGAEETYTGTVDSSLTAVVQLHRLLTVYTVTCGDARKTVNIGYYYQPLNLRVAPYSYATDGLMIYFDAKDNTRAGHDASAAVWEDLSGNGNDGAINNGAWDTEALIFNGSSTWVNCGARNYSNISVEAFVLLNTVPSSEMEIGVNYENGGYGLSSSNGKHSLIVNVGGTYKTASSPDTITAGTFAHVLGTYDGTDLKVYVNGVLKTTLTAAGTIKSPTYNTVFALGTNPNGSSGSSGWLNGRIRSFRLYNRALTAQEVAENYAFEADRYE